MSTTPNTLPDPIGYAVYNGAGQVVDTAVTQTEAFRVIDWLTIHDHAAGPYRTEQALIGGVL